jgi:hypothetical protein
MEYKGFNALLNKYPNRESYKKDSLETIVLNGIYPQNQIQFKTPPLEEIKIVDDTQFRFVIALRNDRDDIDVVGLYTSPIFFTEMVTSVNENNPYFTQNGVNPQFLVSFYINEIISEYNAYINLEKEIGVDVSRNIFLLNSGEYDFNELIKYIDWIISKPALNERMDNAVLPVPILGNYQYREFNFDTSTFDNINNELNQIRLRQLEGQLFDINEVLGELEEFVNNPDISRISNIEGIRKIVGSVGITALKSVKFSILKGLVAKIGLGATLGPIGIAAGLLVGGISALIGNKKKKQQAEADAEAALNRIKGEIRSLKERRINIENELKTLQN